MNKNQTCGEGRTEAVLPEESLLDGQELLLPPKPPPFAERALQFWRDYRPEWTTANILVGVVLALMVATLVGAMLVHVNRQDKANWKEYGGQHQKAATVTMEYP